MYQSLAYSSTDGLDRPRRLLSEGEPADETSSLIQLESMVRGRGNSRASRSNASDQTLSFDPEPVNFEEILDDMTPEERDTGDRLRRHLQFFFMDPLEKWKVRKQFPFKLALQILKILFVTVQLTLFAELRISHVDFMEDTNTVMRHKFLKDWNDDRDALQYPPSEGRYSVYGGDGIFEHLQFIVAEYYNLRTEMFSSFSYDLLHVPEPNERTSNFSVSAEVPFEKIPQLKFCVDRIRNVTVSNNTYIFDSTPIQVCHSLNFTSKEVDDIKADPANIESTFAARGITFRPEDALIISKASVEMNLRTIHFSPDAGEQRPECYLLKTAVTFDNSRHTGQIHIFVTTDISYERVCNGRVLQTSLFNYDIVIMGIIDVCVLFMCLASLILCVRALIKAHLLKGRAVDYFDGVLKYELTSGDKLEFLNLWYVMILINDICIIIGTICKITIEFRDFDNDLFTWTGILLGTGALLVYVGILRYFKFFNKYNLLILTLKKSLPNILRFLSCAIVIYCGFLIAGWVIIGPYSLKFRTLAQCSEALFSLVNGDDMFATFYTINDSNTTIKVFGTIYIYIFVSLFIYVVLSLFIAIIMDAYEVVKERYMDSVVVERSTLRDFMATAPPVALDSPTVRQQYAPHNLLNLGAGNDSDRSVRALRVIDRMRDAIRDRLNGTRFESFTNPIHDQDDVPVVDGNVRRTQMTALSTDNGNGTAGAAQL